LIFRAIVINSNKTGKIYSRRIGRQLMLKLGFVVGVCHRELSVEGVVCWGSLHVCHVCPLQISAHRESVTLDINITTSLKLHGLSRQCVATAPKYSREDSNMEY